MAMLRDVPLDAPGPGSYESAPSIFDRSMVTPRKGTVINPITVVSPIAPGRAAAVLTNPSLQKMSVPSIPSRFLTPVIDPSQDEFEASGDVCKMSRLVDDPGKVGPGSYVILED